MVAVDRKTTRVEFQDRDLGGSFFLGDHVLDSPRGAKTKNVLLREALRLKVCGEARLNKAVCEAREIQHCTKRR